MTLVDLSVTVVGLQGNGLVLQEKGGDELAVTGRAGGEARKVTFTTAIRAGTEYVVTVKTQPTGPMQNCAVTGGAGTVVAGGVPSITVN